MSFLLSSVNDSLGGVSQFIVDESTGKITGYKTEIGGADTVFPFSGGGKIVCEKKFSVPTKETFSFTIDTDYPLYILMAVSANNVNNIIVGEEVSGFMPNLFANGMCIFNKELELQIGTIPTSDTDENDKLFYNSSNKTYYTTGYSSGSSTTNYALFHIE